MRKLLLLIAVVAIIVFGIWEALWTNRWALSDETEQAAAKLVLVPLTIGDWVGQEHKLDQRQVARAEMTGYLSRPYTNGKTGKSVQILLVCGRSGPTALHPPDVCYQGAGYALTAAQVKHTVTAPSPAAADDFWVGQFAKSGPDRDPLRIFWSWSATGNWTASTNPRWTFGAEPFLYKLYVIRSLPKLDEPLTDDPAVDFLRVFLPELRKSLFPSPTGKTVGRPS